MSAELRLVPGRVSGSGTDTVPSVHVASLSILPKIVGHNRASGDPQHRRRSAVAATSLARLRTSRILDSPCTEREPYRTFGSSLLLAHSAPCSCPLSHSVSVSPLATFTAHTGASFTSHWLDGCAR